jgi:peptide/nickel transport system permease protein
LAKFLVRRFFTGILTIIAVSVLIFSMSRLQGDPRLLYLSSDTTQEQYEAWGKAMGLDKPLVVQYGIWAGKVLRGDLGRSLSERRSVGLSIWERLPATLQLGFASLLFALALGIPLGVLSAVKRGTFWDYTGRTFAMLGQAMPPFWLGLMLIYLFSVDLGWLPTGRRGGISHYILPTITLGWLSAAAFLRLVRSAMLEVLDSEYIKLARAKGVKNYAVIWKHAFRNSLIPTLTFGGIILAGKFTGAVVTESIFAWPGIGRLALNAVHNNDFPLLSGVIMFFMLIYIGLALAVDVAYAYVDPRIRYR